MLIPRTVVFVGGAAIGLMSALLRSRESGKQGAGRLTPNTLFTQPISTMATTRVSTELSPRYSTLQKRVASLEALVEAHDAKLRNVPTTEQIVEAMDQVFERGAAALHARFAEQTRALENLQAVVGQTDELLEKILDSIYSLQPESPTQDPGRDPSSLNR